MMTLEHTSTVTARFPNYAAAPKGVNGWSRFVGALLSALSALSV